MSFQDLVRLRAETARGVKKNPTSAAAEDCWMDILCLRALSTPEFAGACSPTVGSQKLECGNMMSHAPFAVTSCFWDWRTVAFQLWRTVAFQLCIYCALPSVHLHGEFSSISLESDYMVLGRFGSPWRLLCSSSSIMTCFLIRDYHILPQKEHDVFS